MLYNEAIKQFEQLKELLYFQERRNFFNHIEDKHLYITSNIVDNILEKVCSSNPSHLELAEILSITVNMINLTNASEETKKLLFNMSNLSKKITIKSLNNPLKIK